MSQQAMAPDDASAASDRERCRPASDLEMGLQALNASQQGGAPVRPEILVYSIYMRQGQCCLVGLTVWVPTYCPKEYCCCKQPCSDIAFHFQRAAGRYQPPTRACEAACCIQGEGLSVLLI